MSHTWKPKSWKAQRRIKSKRRQFTRIRQLSTNQRANFSAEEVRTLVEQMRTDGVPIPHLRDEQGKKPTGELHYEAAGGES